MLESPLPSELHEMAATGVPVLVLADRAEPADALAAAQLGARALLTKNCSLAELVVAIRDISGGAPAAPAARLTARQRQVLELIVEGLDNSQIAARLGVSERTARAHVSAVLERLGCRKPHSGRGGSHPARLADAADVRRGPAGPPARVRFRSGHSGGAARGAGPSHARRGRQRGCLGERRLRSHGLQVEGGRQARPRIRAEARHHLRRPGPAGAGGQLRDGRARRRPDRRGRASRRPLSARLGGPKPRYRRPAAPRRTWSATPASSEVDGRVYGDESFFDGRRGGPSGFGISPYVGPLSALAFNRGSLLPVARGWQHDPPRLHRRTHARILRSEEVAVGRGGTPGRTPADATTLAAIESPPLEALVRHTNQRVRQLLRRDAAEGPRRPLGRARARRRRARGSRALRAGGGLQRTVVDGSGLSRGNRSRRATSAACCSQAQDEPWFDAFYRSLPLAGSAARSTTGCAARAASGRCRAKTGTLVGVSALAGYCRAPDGRRRHLRAPDERGQRVAPRRRVQDQHRRRTRSYGG